MKGTDRSRDPHIKGPHMKGAHRSGYPHIKGPHMNRIYIPQTNSAGRKSEFLSIESSFWRTRAPMYFWKPQGKIVYPVHHFEDQGEPSETQTVTQHMELGPALDDPQWPRGEFYTHIIYTRNGTCSAIVRDITCFGPSTSIVRRVGRIGKTMVSIPMCPEPTAITKMYAQFTCDTGVGYMAPVLMHTTCGYLPCAQGYWKPEWTQEKYWNGGNAYKEEYWGSKKWWSSSQRGDYANWFQEREADSVEHTSLHDD